MDSISEPVKRYNGLNVCASPQNSYMKILIPSGAPGWLSWENMKHLVMSLNTMLGVEIIF